jgi:hypothetical protein
MKSFLIIALLLLAFQVSNAQKLVKLWETDTVFSGPESVVYDSIRDLLYVSNFTKKIKDNQTGTEYISKVNIEGEVVDLKWIQDITRPLGVSIFNDQLYIVERKNIAIYDLKTDQLVKRVFIDSCRFINDVSVGTDSTIYVSECNTKVTYAIKNGKSEKWIDSDFASFPNGILFDKGNLIVAANGDSALKAVNVNTKEITLIAQMEKGIIDGIKTIDDDYLVSFYEGNIFRVTKNGKITELLNTRAEGINLADFEYIESKRLLIAPSLKSNKLVAYKFE